MKYTVIGIYGDNQQPWMIFVEDASSPKEAARKGIQIVQGEGKESVPLSEILSSSILRMLSLPRIPGTYPSKTSTTKGD